MKNPVGIDSTSPYVESVLVQMCSEWVPINFCEIFIANVFANNLHFLARIS